MANNITIKDASAANVTVKSTDNASVQLPAHQVCSSDGTNALAVSSAGAAKVEGAGTAGTAAGGVLTVQGSASGTAIPVTATATQSGTWTVQPGNTANTTAWKVDGSAVTQPVSAASLPLPSGASTAAKQPALGTAGTASSDVLTIQGIASMTKLLVTPDANSAVNVAQVAGATAQSGSGTATGALRVELPTNGTGVIATVTAVTAITNALPAGTNGIGKLTANAGVTIGAVEIAAAQTLATVTTLSTLTGSSVAAGAADTGNPHKIGGQARTTNPTAVDDADRVDAIFDKLGKQVVVGAIRDLKGNQQTQISNSTSEVTIATAVASTFLDLYGLILANTGATTTKVSIRDDTAGTVRMIIEVPTLETRGFMLPVDSGVNQTATNKNWTAQCASATTAMEVTALFVKNT